MTLGSQLQQIQSPSFMLHTVGCTELIPCVLLLPVPLPPLPGSSWDEPPLAVDRGAEGARGGGAEGSA